MLKRLTLAPALVLCVGVLFFPLTAHAAEVDAVPVTDEEITTVEVETDVEISAVTEEIVAEESEPEESESGVPPYDGPMYLSPDGTGTVVDNVYIDGNGLEFFTFTTEDGNVFYLVIDRLRTKDNVYFLNAVTEEDLLALAEKKDGGGTSISGVPTTTNGTQTEEPAESNPPAEQPTAEKGNNGMLIFMIIGVAVFGGVAFYFKIIRPKQQPRDDEDDGADDFDDTDDDYTDDPAGDGEDQA